jgi:hypothetical protein
LSSVEWGREEKGLIVSASGGAVREGKFGAIEVGQDNRVGAGNPYSLWKLVNSAHLPAVLRLLHSLPAHTANLNHIKLAYSPKSSCIGIPVMPLWDSPHSRQENCHNNTLKNTASRFRHV